MSRPIETLTYVIVALELARRAQPGVSTCRKRGFLLLSCLLLSIPRAAAPKERCSFRLPPRSTSYDERKSAFAWSEVFGCVFSQVRKGARTNKPDRCVQRGLIVLERKFHLRAPLRI